MGVFTCPGCNKFRNDFDKLANGKCRSCGGGGVVRPSIKQPLTREDFFKQPALRNPAGSTKYPCAECGKWCGPADGRMFKNSLVFCHNCLNSGRYLDYYKRKGVHMVQVDAPKPRRNF